MEPLTPAPPARDHTAIPIYKLYGYGNVWTASDPLYCETIAAQERLHNWHVAAHKHTDLFQVLFLESGEVTVLLDGQARTLGPGQLVLVPQRVVHEFIFRPGSDGYILTLTYALLHGLCARFGLALSAATDPGVLTLDADETGRHTALSFRQLDREYRGLHSPQRGPLLESLLSGILVWIHRQGYPAGTAATGADPGSQHLARYARMIEAHHTRQHRVAWYAQRIGVTPAHLNAIVQALAGKSALELIHERLLLEARRELIYTPRTIGAISDSLGFADPGYFTRFFKRLAGVSPKDFRRRALAPGADQATGQATGQTTGS
ncbi:helix-turn-helix domain-containing protein [Castellaniella sp.]|uniref:helix-turn-helix domain-containing protein n=2 Tax=Castellaniella sp. TaxID=1955812 RepID=UPI002AFE3E2F|nr:helix-turn-helix domain-containing protein [Castellaniella sp.]